MKHRLIAALFFLFKHFEHPVGHGKAADHVQRTKNNGHKTDTKRHPVVGRGIEQDDNCPDQHYPVNRIRAGHERRVQHRRHFADDLNAEQNAESSEVENEDILLKKIEKSGHKPLILNGLSRLDEIRFQFSKQVMEPGILEQQYRFAVSNLAGFNHFEGVFKPGFEHFDVFLFMFDATSVVHFLLF